MYGSAQLPKMEPGVSEDLREPHSALSPHPPLYRIHRESLGSAKIRDTGSVNTEVMVVAFLGLWTMLLSKPANFKVQV